MLAKRPVHPPPLPDPDRESVSVCVEADRRVSPVGAREEPGDFAGFSHRAKENNNAIFRNVRPIQSR